MQLFLVTLYLLLFDLCAVIHIYSQGSGYGSFPGQTYNGGGGGNGYGGGRGGGHHGGGDYGYGGGPHGGGGGHPPMGGGPGGGGGGDYSAQWADYYRSLGMTREAELIEQQQQQGGSSNPGDLKCFYLAGLLLTCITSL